MIPDAQTAENISIRLTIRDPKLVDLHELDALVRKYHLYVPSIGTGQAWGEEGLSLTDPSSEIRSAAIDRIKSHIPVANHCGAIIIIGLIRGIVKPSGGMPGNGLARQSPA